MYRRHPKSKDFVRLIDSDAPTRKPIHHQSCYLCTRQPGALDAFGVRATTIAFVLPALTVSLRISLSQALKSAPNAGVPSN